MRAPRLTLLPLASILMLAGAAHAATVYKWVDEQGVIHFSDQPHPQAQEVEVKQSNTYQGAPPATPTGSNPTIDTKPQQRTYALCELYRPENDEVFLNTSTLTAKLRLQPSLVPGDKIYLAVDGKRVMNQSTSTTDFVLNEVERGTHVLVAVVEDPEQKVICASPAVTFHVRQPSVQAPVRSVRPRF
jgi:uncharacterized protein DUF4124